MSDRFNFRTPFYGADGKFKNLCIGMLFMVLRLPFFDTHYLFLFLKRYTVFCPNCNYETEKYATPKEAARAWNRIAGEE